MAPGSGHLVLEVEVMSARGLQEADWAGFGRSERICICEIPGKPRTQVQTPPLDDTKDAAWMHKLEIPGYTRGDPLKVSIVATHSQYKKWQSCLGEAHLTGKAIGESSCFEGELSLGDLNTTTGYLRVKVQIRGDGEEQQEAKLEEEQLDIPLAPLPKPKQRSRQARPVPAPTILDECLKEVKPRHPDLTRTPSFRSPAASATATTTGLEEAPGVDSEKEEEAVCRLSDLPPGWEAAWDQQLQRYYFYNHDLCKTTWEWPGAKGTAAASRQAGGAQLQREETQSSSVVAL